MKDRLIGFIKTYCLFVCIFVLQKPLFMLFYKSLYPDASCADWFSVIWHGLPLDLSLAGYLTAIPGFLFITSVWTLSKSLHRIWCGYFLFISVLISIIFTVDLGLYEYWGFRLDATPLFYFFSSPKDAVASVSIWMVLGGIVAMAVYAVVYNPQIQISAESETKRSIFREKDKTKRSKKESAQHSKSRNKSFVMTSVSAL